MSQNVLLEFKKLTKSFDGKVVLNGIDLTIPEGKMTAIIGKSGTGKSVMLKHVARLVEPTSGDIYYKGTPFSSLKGRKKKKLKDQFSYMFQHNALFDSYTLFDNVALPLRETTKLSHIPASAIFFPRHAKCSYISVLAYSHNLTVFHKLKPENITQVQSVGTGIFTDCFCN